LPRTEEGYHHNFNCGDPFPKWLIPLRSKSSDEVWDAFYLNIFSRFGVP
jgi:hypothetical protein